MKVSEKMISNMEEEKKYGQTAQFMMAYFILEKKMDKENLFFQMDQFIK